MKKLVISAVFAPLALSVPTDKGPIVMVDYASVDCWAGGHVRTWLPTK